MSCKDCEYAPKTYAEYCKSKNNSKGICPDAFTKVSIHCGSYNKAVKKGITNNGNTSN